MTESHPRWIAGPLALAVTSVLVLSACSGSDEKPENPEDALATAQKQLDETSGVKLSLSTEELPEGVDGLVDASGVVTNAPAFEGTVDLRVNDLGLNVPVIAVDGLVFAKLPFTKVYNEIDPEEYGAPDPAVLMEDGTGLSYWMAEATSVKEGESTRDGDTVLTSYAGTLPGEVVNGFIPSADKAADFPVTFFLDEDSRLRSVDVTGPFYGKGGDVDYRVELSDYGTEKDITRP